MDERSEILQIRIEGTFDSDRGFLAVTGENLEIFRKNHQFGLDRLDDAVVIAAGQICPSDGGGEQSIAGEKGVDRLKIIGNTARSMTRSRNDGEIIHRGRPVSLRQILGCGNERHKSVFRTFIERNIARMQENIGDIECGSNLPRSGNMINMPVRKKDHFF